MPLKCVHIGLSYDAFAGVGTSVTLLPSAHFTISGVQCADRLYIYEVHVLLRQIMAAQLYEELEYVLRQFPSPPAAISFSTSQSLFSLRTTLFPTPFLDYFSFFLIFHFCPMD